MTVSTDHSSSMPPFEMGSNSIDIDSPLATGESPLANAGMPSAIETNPSSGQSVNGLQDDAFDAGRCATTDIPGPRVDAIEFRVIRPGVPVRRLRLTGNRYTFGSAEGCSIRLNDATLRPMHAVLIRDANRVLVRAYSVPLEINGNRVAETSLQIGDVLRMGAYRLELLSGIDPAARLTSAVTDSMAGAPHSADASDMASQSLHSRLQREAAQWRLRQSEVDLRENRCIERETELRARESEMWARADQLHRRESQLMSQETAAMQIQEEYLSRKEELARLREESQVQRRLLDERQDQIQNMETEYQHQVENATRQLELSQQQAESATEAVQRMREQFASLNDQLERLNQQQLSLETNDESHMEQHRQLHRELETARDEAIDARAKSEALRHKAEDRVAELLQQIEAIQSDETAHADRVSESEAAANELRQQIDELENRVRQATEETSQLREDYEGACASIRQLELLVDQTTAERDDARCGLEIESDALRQSVEQLTADLGQANLELGDLRAANDLLSTDLDETRQQRDEAVEDAQSRPSSEAFDALREELDTVKSRLEQMQQEYDETLAKIGSPETDASAIERPETDDSKTDNVLTHGTMAHSEPHLDETPSSESLVNLGLIGGTALADEVLDSSESTSEANTSQESDEENQDDDREAWPTYQSPSTEHGSDSEIESNAGSEPQEAEAVNQLTTEAVDEDPWQCDEVDSSEANAQSDMQAFLSDTDHAESHDAESHDAESHDAESHDAESYDVDNAEPSPIDDATSNHWRPDGNESVENAGHLSAWDSAESTDQESAADDTPHWQNESPETAVDEAIADIEHSVDQAIADIDSQSFDSPEAENDDDSSVSNNVTAIDDVVEQDEEPNPWATESVANNDDVDVESSYADVWKDNQSEQETEEDSLGGYQPIDPWSRSESDTQHDAQSDDADADYDKEHITASDDPAQDAPAGSLADMLIRDMDQDSEDESVTPSADAYNQPLSAYDDEEDEPVESTFVMDQAATESDEEVSPWNLNRPDDAPQSELHSDSDTEQVESTSETVEAAQEEAPAEDDDSIEAYMNRLLKRVQTEPGESEESLDDTQSVALSGNTALMDSADTVAETTVEEQIDPNTPLVPRSQAPERSRNMSAMRELANQSARSAVARSVKIQARDTQVKAAYKFLGAATGIACGLLCIYFREQLGLIWCGMCSGLGVIVAVMYGQEGMALWKEANARIKSTESADTDQSDSAESPAQAIEGQDSNDQATQRTDAMSAEAHDGDDATKPEIS